MCSNTSRPPFSQYLCTELILSKADSFYVKAVDLDDYRTACAVNKSFLILYFFKKVYRILSSPIIIKSVLWAYRTSCYPFEFLSHFFGLIFIPFFEEITGPPLFCIVYLSSTSPSSQTGGCFCSLAIRSYDFTKILATFHFFFRVPYPFYHKKRNFPSALALGTLSAVCGGDNIVSSCFIFQP